MSTLIELLGNNHDFNILKEQGYNWVAQDYSSLHVFAYANKPVLYEARDRYKPSANYAHIGHLPTLASDWETPYELSQPEEPKVSEATMVQATPKGEGEPILNMVITDLTNRSIEGVKKYGEPLKAFNSRSAPVDALQEVYDLAMYLRQDVEERKLMAAQLVALANGMEMSVGVKDAIKTIAHKLWPLG